MRLQMVSDTGQSKCLTCCWMPVAMYPVAAWLHPCWSWLYAREKEYACLGERYASVETQDSHASRHCF
eukprot:scaffold10477_cov13-Tisochrysis_lutea.AAC.1